MMRKVFRYFEKIIFVNKKIIIPICIGITIIVVGIIVGIIGIPNQESEIPKSNDENDFENKTTGNPIIDENDFENKTTGNPIIDEKLNQIEKNAAENYFKPAPREWQTSGPFQIDRSEYLLGEKIFIRIGGLNPDEKGQIAFLRPSNGTHYTVWQTIPFDGMKKNAFNYYTQPVLSTTTQVCTVDDILGEWVVVFRGTNYPNLKFDVINEIVPGDEESYVPVC